MHLKNLILLVGVACVATVNAGPAKNHHFNDFDTRVRTAHNGGLVRGKVTDAKPKRSVFKRFKDLIKRRSKSKPGSGIPLTAVDESDPIEYRELPIVDDGVDEGYESDV